MITAFACTRSGLSVDNPLAACSACGAHRCEPVEDRRSVIPALARIDRRPGQPSVNAVSSVSLVLPTVSRLRRTHCDVVSVLATAPKTCRPPSGVLDLPTQTSRRRSRSRRPRMKVEIKLMVTADAAAAGLRDGALRSCSPTLSVWPAQGLGLLPASTGKDAPARQRRRERHRGGRCARS